MKKIILLMLYTVTILSQETEVEWIWKNDPILDKYKTGNDFGLKLVESKLVYDVLYEKDERANAFTNPLRVLDGEFVDLSARFKEVEMGNLLKNIYIRTRQRPHGKIEPKMPEWRYRNFMIMQVIPGEGFLGIKGHGDGGWEDGPFFVHAPHIKDKVDDEWIRGFFKKQGNYQYETTQGAIKTVHKYVYGNLPEAEKLTEGIDWLKQKYAKPSQ